MHSVVFALIHFSVHSLYHSSLYSLDQSCACSVTHSFIPPPFVHSSIHSFIQLFFHSHVHLFTHSFIHYLSLGSPQEAWLLSSAPPPCSFAFLARKSSIMTCQWRWRGQNRGQVGNFCFSMEGTSVWKEFVYDSGRRGEELWGCLEKEPCF